MNRSVLGCLVALASLFSYAASAQNITLDSREYKVGLAVDRLPREAAAVDEAIRNRLGPIKKIVPLRKKQAQVQVQFFDTDSCVLTKNAMLLRARTKSNKAPRLTLKIRNPDILVVDTMPIALVSGKTVGIEDDYSIGQDGKPASNFSKSLSFDSALPLRLADIGSHVVNLAYLGQGASQLALRGGPRVAETVFVSKPVPITDQLAAEVEISLWYEQAGGALLAADVSFTVQAPFDHPQLQAADQLLMDFAQALRDFRGATAEKALAIIPKMCR